MLSQKISSLVIFPEVMVDLFWMPTEYGFSVSRTMTVAQKLYETGKITYMRTDSVNLSETAIDAAAQEIKSAYSTWHQAPK